LTKPSTASITTRALGFDETLNCEYHHLVHETVPDREELI